MFDGEPKASRSVLWIYLPLLLVMWGSIAYDCWDTANQPRPATHCER